MKLLALASCVGLALTACRTTSTQVPIHMESAVVVRATPVSAWSVTDQGVLVGYVVRFDTPERVDHSYFSVRNEHRQELGMVDRDGRAWRYRPHVRDAEWIGTGTVQGGVRRILDASEHARMSPIPVESLGAIAPSTSTAPPAVPPAAAPSSESPLSPAPSPVLDGSTAPN